MAWLFVDDSQEDREAFARELSADGVIEVEAISAGETRRRLGEEELRCDGLLMDIDLSNESGRRESGLGLTADIRGAQQQMTAPSFPIVRFSYRSKVAESIGRDGSSDESFDLKVDKDELDSECVRRDLAGVAAVYGKVGRDSSALEVLGVEKEEWLEWGHIGFEEALEVADRDHLRSRLVVQVIMRPGLLICEELLATRLGVERGGSGWEELLEELRSFAYRGVGAEYFSRWWARGLERWWEGHSGVAPLGASTIEERYRVLSGPFSGLVPLTMPGESPGERPWRRCELTMERSGEFVPLDPSCAVRFSVMGGFADWMDPTYAALGVAARHREDRRLDEEDYRRLRSLAGRESV